MKHDRITLFDTRTKRNFIVFIDSIETIEPDTKIVKTNRETLMLDKRSYTHLMNTLRKLDNTTKEGK